MIIGVHQGQKLVGAAMHLGTMRKRLGWPVRNTSGWLGYSWARQLSTQAQQPCQMPSSVSG